MVPALLVPACDRAGAIGWQARTLMPRIARVPDVLVAGKTSVIDSGDNLQREEAGRADAAAIVAGARCL
jgi:hypothetical protein